jgi:fucose permease
MRDRAAGKKLIVTVSYLTIGMLGVYLSFYQYILLGASQLFLLDAAMVGLLIAVHSIGISLPPLFMGPLCAKIGKKRLLMISYSLIILGTFLAGIAGNFAGFIACILLIGAGFSVTEGTLSAVLSDEYPDESTRHLNFSQVAFSAGAMAGPFAAQGLISSGVFFKDLFFYISAVFLILGIIFSLTRHQNDRGLEMPCEGPLFAVSFLRSRVFLLLALSIFLYVGMENTVSSFSDSYFELQLGVPALSAVALSLFWGAMIPSRFLAGVLKTDRKKLFTGLSILAVSAAAAAMLVPGHTAKVILFAVCGFGCGPLWPLLMDSVAQKKRGSTGPALNMMMAFSGFGGAVVPFLAGFLVLGFKIEAAAYFLSAALGAVMLTLFLFTLKKGVKKAPEEGR